MYQNYQGLFIILKIYSAAINIHTWIEEIHASAGQCYRTVISITFTFYICHLAFSKTTLMLQR